MTLIETLILTGTLLLIGFQMGRAWEKALTKTSKENKK
jgi:hypothetical protein